MNNLGEPYMVTNWVPIYVLCQHQKTHFGIFWLNINHRHQNQQPENSTGLNLKINSEFFLEKVPLSRALNVIQLQL